MVLYKRIWLKVIKRSPCSTAECIILIHAILCYIRGADPKVIKRFPRSTQMSTKFILPKHIGILTFISMIYTTSERLKARNLFICQYLRFY